MREELLPLDLLDVLLDPDNHMPIALMDESGKIMHFEQVAVVPYTFKDNNKELYAILAPTDLEEVDEHAAIVFRVVVEEDGTAALRAEEDPEIAQSVFAAYLELLDERIGERDKKEQ